MKNIFYGIVLTIMLFGLCWMFIRAIDKEIEIRENFTAPYIQN